MNACVNTKAALTASELDESLGVLVQGVDDLLQAVTSKEPQVTSVAQWEVGLSSALSFPDEIGRGDVAATLFRYRDGVRLDVRVEHNRVFARADGGPSERPCFLNDFVASITIAAGSTELPEPFVRHVVAGVAAARDAVRRHNRRNDAPWSEIQVAAAD